MAALEDGELLSRWWSQSRRRCRYGKQRLIDAPLRWEEELDRRRVLSESRLDPAASTGQLRDRLSAVLVGLAEQPLAVDGMQRPAEQALERQTEPVHLRG